MNSADQDRPVPPLRNLPTGIETIWILDVRVRHRYISDDAGRRRHAFQDGSAFGDYGLGANEGLRQDYDYDDLGQLKTVKSSFAQAPTVLGAAPEPTARSVPDRQYGYAYDQAGNRTGAAFKHSSATAPPQTAFYDSANQLVRRDPGPVSVRGLADSNTQVAVEDIDANAQTKAEQVEKVSGSNYWHKQLEFISTAEEWRRYGRNIFIGALRSGAANQESRFVLFQGKGATMKYDADGNLTEDDKWQYTWDAENRLVRQQSLDWLANAGAGPRLDISYRYDYLGRRVSKHVFTLDATGTPVAQTQSQYYYDGWNVIAEATMDPATAQPVFQRTYTWGLDVAGSLTASGGVGALLQIADHADGQRYFPAYDGNGNVSALLNATNGAVAASYEYSPYGESLRGAGGIAAANPFRFSTKFTDNETGLVYYGMRYYDPEKGRFVNRDPIEERGGLNLYGFCGNDGVNRYDVLGMFGWDDLNPFEVHKKLRKKVRKFCRENQWVGIAVGAVAGFFTAGATWAAMGTWASANAVAAGAIAGAAGGFVSGVTTATLMGGSFGQAVTAGAWGALGGAVAGGIGGYFGPAETSTRAFSWTYEGQRALAHGLAQGGVGALRGQRFGAAFISGFAGSFAGSGFGRYLPDAHWSVAIAGVGTIGGVSSRIGGGRFEDGFASAAAVQAFNHLLHPLAIDKKDALLRTKRGMELELRLRQAQDQYVDGSPIPITSGEIVEVAEYYALLKNQDQRTGYWGDGQADSVFFADRNGKATIGHMEYVIDGTQIQYGGKINYLMHGINTALNGGNLSGMGMRTFAWNAMQMEPGQYLEVRKYEIIGFNAAQRVLKIAPRAMSNPDEMMHFME